MSVLEAAPVLVGSTIGVLVFVAAVSDARSGRIPNVLTLPPLIVAPLAAVPLAGLPAAGGAVVGLLVCGAVPMLLYRAGACGGGDVKLLTALGALAGARLGLQIELLGFAFASAYGLARLVWRGGLLRSLRRSLALLGRGTCGDEAQLTAVRLGPWVCMASLVAIALRGVP